MFFAGCCGFLVCIIGDVNDAVFHKRWLKPAFYAGVGLIVLSTVWLALGAAAPVSAGWRAVFGAAGLLMLGLTVYSVFLCVPPSGKAAADGARPAVTTGMYALCRHPGALWSIFLYICLWGATGLPAYAAAVYPALNVIYVFVQDRWLFPRFLSGYDEYRKTTPFIFPTPGSLRRCIKGTGA